MVHCESVSLHSGRETGVLKDDSVENLRNSYEAVENNGESVKDEVGGSVAIGSRTDLDNEGTVENKEAVEQVRKLVQCIIIFLFTCPHVEQAERDLEFHSLDSIMYNLIL